MSNTIQNINTIYVGYSPNQLLTQSAAGSVPTSSEAETQCITDKKINAELNIADGVPFFSSEHIITPDQNFGITYGESTISLDLSNNGILYLNHGETPFWSACDKVGDNIGHFGLLNRAHCDANGIINAVGNVIVNPYCKLDAISGNFTCYDATTPNNIPYIQWNMNPTPSGKSNYMIINGFSDSTYAGNSNAGYITMISGNNHILASTSTDITGDQTAHFDNAHTCEKTVAESTLVEQSRDHEASRQLNQDAIAIYNIQCMNRTNLIIGILGTLWYAYYLSKS